MVTHPPTMIGSVLGGRYRILDKLGEGAMSEVYLVDHIHIGRREAVKVLKPELARDPAFVSRFRREARAINRVQHPGIIGIYDFGQLPDGRLYLGLEYASGRGVDAILRDEGPFAVPRAVRIIHQLGAAAEHAHTHGVVHRDLKPANLVLVEHRGQLDVLKVLDFGMAKIVCTTETEELTLQGELFGTSEYMAPESLDAMGSDPRTDIYAIGCVAHELLVGEPPFTGNRVQLAHAHLERLPLPPSQRAPDAGIPAVLDSIVLQCLAKEPAARFQTGRQLCGALEQVPGFSRGRGSVRTRRMWNAGFPVEVHDEATNAEPLLSPELSDNSLAVADTASAEAVDVRDELFRALLGLGEQIVDSGRHDDGVVVGIAMVQECRDDRAALLAKRELLEEREARLEQSTREREGSLRFAIGDLQFDAQAGACNPHNDLAFQIERLQQRLAELLSETGRQLDDITEQAIGLAAAEAKLDDRWVEANAGLAQALKACIGRLDLSPDVLPFITRYRAIEASLEQMSLLGG